ESAFSQQHAACAHRRRRRISDRYGVQSSVPPGVRKAAGYLAQESDGARTRRVTPAVIPRSEGSRPSLRRDSSPVRLRRWLGMTDGSATPGGKARRNLAFQPFKPSRATRKSTKDGQGL